jgi:hypothetical protein
MARKKRDEEALGELAARIRRSLPDEEAVARDDEAAVAGRGEPLLADADVPANPSEDEAAIADRHEVPENSPLPRVADEPFCWLLGRFQLTHEAEGTTLRSEGGGLIARARGPFVLVERGARVPAETVEAFRALVAEMRSE